MTFCRQTHFGYGTLRLFEKLAWLSWKLSAPQLSTFYLAVANHAVFNLKNNKHKHPPDIKCSCKQVVANLEDFRAASFLEDARLYCQDLGGESLEVSGD